MSRHVVDVTATDIAAQVEAALGGYTTDAGPIPTMCRKCGVSRTIPRPQQRQVLKWICPACDAVTEARLTGPGTRQRVEVRLEGGEWGE